MFKVTLKGLRAHARRLISTLLAVFSGIAFLAGTMMLSDTIGKTFDDLFADVYQGTDAVVRSSGVIEGSFGSDDVRGRIDASLVDKIKDLDGVAEVEGSVQSYAQIVGKDGEVLGDPTQGPPTFGSDWPEFQDLNPFHLVEGDAPQADDEVVIDRRSADDGDIAVGDRIQVLTKDRPFEVTVSGIAKFGDADSPGGASFVMFTQDAAEQHLAEPGKVDTISGAAESGVDQAELRDRIATEMPEGVEVLTGAELTDETQSNIADALKFFTIFLGVFAGVALVVSVFSIYNTFSIVVAQRTREMALLRAVGASRRQVLGSIFVEATVLGVVASLLGILGGIVMTGILKSLLKAFGVDIPAGGLVLKPRTIVISLVVGLIVTLISAVGPAVRASRVPPLAAIRDVAVDRAARSRLRLVLGIVVVLLGIGATFSALSGSGSSALSAAGGGVVLVLIGTIILGPIVARPLSRVIGAPLRRVRGVTGHLAEENSARNPKRTANAAAALLIGVGVVGFFTVLSASLKHSIETILDRTVTGDFVIDSGSFGGSTGGLSPELAADLNELPEVEAASGLRFGQVEIDGSGEFITAVDPTTFDQIVNTEVKEGSLDNLGTDGIAVFTDKADSHHLKVGDPVSVRFAQTGKHTFRVAAIYDRSELVGNYLLSTDAYAANVPDQFDSQVYVTLASGVSMEDGRKAIESKADAYPQAKVQDQDEFKSSQAGQVNQILGLVYAMLAFAVLIALMGIANTLSLSIHERTRELGLLRAVGMSRSQLRSSVRWESVIIAVFGTLGGLGIAVFFGWVAVTAADEEALTFTFPVASLLVIVILAALAGILAGLRPARRAAKLDILKAIATE
ncbi:MAG TPA: FtsX-like permease family protein [Acidimicrobiales bacterium]